MKVAVVGQRQDALYQAASTAAVHCLENMLQHSHNVQHNSREGVTIFQRRFLHFECNQRCLAWLELDLGLTLSALKSVHTWSAALRGIQLLRLSSIKSRTMKRVLLGSVLLTIHFSITLK